MELVVALSVLAVGFLIWNIYHRLMSRHSLDWRRLAENARFDYFSGSDMQWPLIRGMFRGREIRMTAEPGDLIVHEQEITRVVEFLLDPLPEGLFIARHGMLGTLENVFVMEQIEIGDSELDSLLLIKGTSPDDVAKLMADTGVRRALLKLFRGYPTARVTNSSITVVLPSIISQLKELQEVLVDLANVADVLEEAIRISSSDDCREGRRSSVDTKVPELRYAQPALSSLYDEDRDLKGPEAESAPPDCEEAPNDDDSERLETLPRIKEP